MQNVPTGRALVDHQAARRPDLEQLVHRYLRLPRPLQDAVAFQVEVLAEDEPTCLSPGEDKLAGLAAVYHHEAIWVQGNERPFYEEDVRG